MKHSHWVIIVLAAALFGLGMHSTLTKMTKDAGLAVRSPMAAVPEPQKEEDCAMLMAQISDNDLAGTNVQAAYLRLASQPASDLRDLNLDLAGSFVKYHQARNEHLRSTYAGWDCGI